MRCCLKIPGHSHRGGHPHGNASLWKRTCFASFWTIVHMDLVNFAYDMIRYHFDAHRPTPQPLAFNLLISQRLITTTTTTMADYMLVFALKKILSLLGLLGQSILLLCHYAERKRIMDNRLAIFVFFLLCSVSSSTVWLYTVASFMRMLRLLFSVFVEFQAPPVGWNMNYSVLSRFQWIRLDTNILEKMPRKTGGKKTVLARSQE